MLFAYSHVYDTQKISNYCLDSIIMKNIQRHLCSIKKRAWKHKIALFHRDRTIKEMEQVYLHTSHGYDSLIFSIHEMKMYRIQEYFEYKNALSILNKTRILTA